MKATLTRTESSSQGTFGYLIVEDRQWFSLELPNRNNEPNLSCIPIGIYDCVWSYSHAFKRFMYMVLDVPRRSGIRIHSANYAGDEEKGFKKQLNGCIALGEKIGKMDGQKALLLSRPAVRRFEEFMKEKNFTLEIR